MKNTIVRELSSRPETLVQEFSKEQVVANKCLVLHFTFEKRDNKITPVLVQHSQLKPIMARLAFRQSRHRSRWATTGNIQITHYMDNMQSRLELQPEEMLIGPYECINQDDALNQKIELNQQFRFCLNEMQQYQGKPKPDRWIFNG